MIDSIVRAQQEREIQSQKRLVAEAELAKERSESVRNLLLLLQGLACYFLLCSILGLGETKNCQRTFSKNKLIEEEQKRSNSLLLNILPPAIADELKTRNKVAARKYEQATVMFIDFKGFTTVAEKLSPACGRRT